LFLNDFAHLRCAARRLRAPCIAGFLKVADAMMDQGVV